MNGEENQEPWFSWRTCDCCNTSLGGNRYNCNGFNRQEQEVYEYVCCEDCIYYSEYGKLDDLTMLDIEKSSWDEELTYIIEETGKDIWKINFFSNNEYVGGLYHYQYPGKQQSTFPPRWLEYIPDDILLSVLGDELKEMGLIPH